MQPTVHTPAFQKLVVRAELGDAGRCERGTGWTSRSGHSRGRASRERAWSRRLALVADPTAARQTALRVVQQIDALLAGQWATAWDALHHVILPALVLAAYNVGLLTRYTRSAVLEVIESISDIRV